MKKSLLLVAIILLFNTLFANPVDVNRAKMLAEKFVKANFELRQDSSVELEYIISSDSNEPCFYIFNVGEQGYVMISANDCVRPVMAYSEESAFDKENIAPGLQFMLDAAKETLTYTINKGMVASPKVETEWTSLERYGTLTATRAKAVGPLCKTKWDQSWPYNKYCPETPEAYGSNGRVVVGCAATAMSQIMRYWGYPTQGIGEYSYTDTTYGYQYVNYGETTYQWDLMPDVLLPTAPVEQIDAVATLCYHAGVSVKMQYDADGKGSGAQSSDVRRAMRDNFGYIDCVYSVKTNTATWAAALKKSIEMGYPIYYAGHNPAPNGGGHAFICDGIDENGLFLFNFGWAGSGDGFFAPEGIEYTEQVVAYMTMIPQNVYDNTAKAPTELVVTPADDYVLSADLSWKNPTETQSGDALPERFNIVVERNGEIIHMEENTTPGQMMTYVDDNVPFFSTFEYRVYAIVDDIHGEMIKVNDISFGPTCSWQLVLQSSVFKGGDMVSVYNAAGDLVSTETTVNSTSKTYDVELPLGKIYFKVTPTIKGTDTDRFTIVIRDSNGTTVFSKTYNLSEISDNPIVYTTINTCGSTEHCDAPTNLVANVEGQSVILSWEGNGNPEYGYNVYRDGKLIAMVDETTYVDDDIVKGGRCYTVSAFCKSADSQLSNETFAVTTEDCAPAENLRYSYNNKNKIVLSWDAPQTSNVTGYYVMRKTDDETEWKRIKALSGSKTEYTDNSSLKEDTWYNYRVEAYYQEIDCLSAPAKSSYNSDEYHVRAFYSTTSIDENAKTQVSIYPNPTNDKITIEAAGIKNITVVNMLGQKVYESSLNADQTVVDFSQLEDGLYMVRVTTDEYEIVERVSVIR